MGNVIVIEATQSKFSKLKDNSKKTINVSAYCRVSTDSGEQLGSYESQKKHYAKLIKEHENWQLIGIYADKGISGTKVAKRKNFNRMIQDAVDGKLDMIIAKSISRFARNTVDTLNYVRILRNHNVDVYFEKENIHTLELTSEMFLTLYSAFAQAESESISENVKQGVRMKMKRGDLVGQYACYGFIYNEKIKNIVPKEPEATTVLMIHKEYSRGVGGTRIAKKLNDLKIPSPRGKKWTGKSIIDIIKLEKYVGDLLTGKTYIDNPINSKKKINHGEYAKYYTKNHHKGIVSNELKTECLTILEKRKTQKYSKLYPFSSKIFCGICGEKYIRRSWNSNNPAIKPRAIWVCRKYNKNHNDCNCVGNVKERVIEDLFVKICSTFYHDKIDKFDENIFEKFIDQIIIGKKGRNDTDLEDIRFILKDKTEYEDTIF